ncbi:MFS general substrate transporter [Hypoxylon trugodes]|uniref:MFS general substrate transporter n=1 Tax=Hypoxylon trugodes TaxID=326681 RepID=UPI00219F9D14|nr:MFS general substrate transporter [Hypoxylon trugodes]KAI1384917.1 MFS general substrate transporter [Hypoxylon trugodes]
MAESPPRKSSEKEVSPATAAVSSDVEQTAGAKPRAELVDEAEKNFQPKSMKFWSVMLSIFLALFIVALDRTIIGTATPQITQEFNSLGDIGWYGSAYQLTSAACQLLFGRVYRFYEVKKTFLFCIAFFEVGSAICGAAPNSIAFIIGRAIAGVGGAGLFTGVSVVMLPLVPLRKRPMFQGLFGSIFGISSVLGPLVGGAFTTHVSWRWCFYLNLPIGAVVALCFLVVKIPTRKPEPAKFREHLTRLDPLGTFFLVPSIVCLLLALQWGGSTYEWGNWHIILLLVLFGVLFLAFAAVQITMPNTATVPVKVITQRSIAAATLFMFSISGPMMMDTYFLPIWFQVVNGVNAVQSGIDTLPLVLSMVVASILSGITTQKLGYYVPSMLLCPSILAVGQGLLSTLKVGDSSAHWIGYQFLVGFGMGTGMQAAGLAAQAVLPKPEIPTGISIMFFFQQLGGSVFTSVGQNLLSSYLVKHLADIPGLDPKQVTSEGATDVLTKVPLQYQGAVKQVYNGALSRIFLCGMGIALVGLLGSLCMEWKNIKKIRQGPPPEANSSDEPKENGSTPTTEEQRTPNTLDTIEEAKRSSIKTDKEDSISSEPARQS